MFGALTKSFKKFLPNNYDRDVRNYAPIVEDINEHFEAFQSLSNDELRQKTLDFRETIKVHLEEIETEIENARKDAEEEENPAEKEVIFAEIDDLKKERNEQLKVVLKEIQAEAFAVMKETTRRFKDNETLRVTATDHDRNLAAVSGKSYVTIEGDEAVWKNTWIAAGNEVTWNMVHYDVQLIGGMVLHDGKIAEMQTGEGKTLVATLPAYLNGVSGKGVHVITVNDYLAKRDSEWVGPVFEFLFLTVDCIDKYKPHSEKTKT